MGKTEWQQEILELVRMEARSHELLGVAPGAGAGEIRSAYRRAARECHPDRRPQDPGASEQFKVVNAAFRFLADGTRNELFLVKAGTERASRNSAKYDLDNPWGYFCWWRDQFF